MKLYITFDLPDDQVDIIREAIFSNKTIPILDQLYYCFPSRCVWGWDILKYDSGCATGELRTISITDFDSIPATDKISITFIEIVKYDLFGSIKNAVYNFAKSCKSKPTGYCCLCEIPDHFDSRNCIQCRAPIVLNPPKKPHEI